MMTDEERTARQVADLMMFIQDATNRKRADILTIENYDKQDLECQHQHATY